MNHVWGAFYHVVYVLKRVSRVVLIYPPRASYAGNLPREIHVRGTSRYSRFLLFHRVATVERLGAQGERAFDPLSSGTNWIAPAEACDASEVQVPESASSHITTRYSRGPCLEDTECLMSRVVGDVWNLRSRRLERSPRTTGSLASISSHGFREHWVETNTNLAARSF